MNVNDTLVPERPGVLKANVEIVVNGLLNQYKKNITAEGIIIDTDYDNYHVVYSCVQIDNFWISQKRSSFILLLRSRYFDSLRRLFKGFESLALTDVELSSFRTISNTIECPN